MGPLVGPSQLRPCVQPQSNRVIGSLHAIHSCRVHGRRDIHWSSPQGNQRGRGGRRRQVASSELSGQGNGNRGSGRGRSRGGTRITARTKPDCLYIPLSLLWGLADFPAVSFSQHLGKKLNPVAQKEICKINSVLILLWVFIKIQYDNVKKRIFKEKLIRLFSDIIVPLFILFLIFASEASIFGTLIKYSNTIISWYLNKIECYFTMPDKKKTESIEDKASMLNL